MFDPKSEPFCCNPKCDNHKKMAVSATTHYILGEGPKQGLHREIVTRTVAGVTIQGKFCNVCLNVIKMFNL